MFEYDKETVNRFKSLVILYLSFVQNSIFLRRFLVELIFGAVSTSLSLRCHQTENSRWIFSSKKPPCDYLIMQSNWRMEVCVTSSSTIEAPNKIWIWTKWHWHNNNKGVGSVQHVECGGMISTFFVSKLCFEDMMIFMPNVVLRFKVDQIHGYVMRAARVACT